MHISRHTLEPSADYPYYVTAKRYSLTDAPTPDTLDSNAITLILSHATGMHKECWEPVLQHLLQSQSNRIVEAWSIDAPNHGEAAVLNDTLLQTNFIQVFPWDEYGRAIGHFLTAGPSRGARIDFTRRNLWALGHSMGAVSMVWLHQSEEFPIRFSTLILCEPMLNPPGFNISEGTAYFFPATYQRRDVWPSREAAFKDFSSSKGYRLWDRRIIELFVNHALRPHPAAEYSVGAYKGVVLACSRYHEAACYRGGMELAATMVHALQSIAKEVPVHVVFGALEDSLPKIVKEALADVENTGVEFASVNWVEKAGHLVVQNDPDGVAEAVSTIVVNSELRKSKL